MPIHGKGFPEAVRNAIKKRIPRKQKETRIQRKGRRKKKK